MNIKAAKAYLEIAHMNRKVAKYLIQTIEDLEELVNGPLPSEKSFTGLFKKSQKLGYVKAMNDIHRILRKEE